MKLEVGMYVRTKDGMIYKNCGEGENYFEEIIYVSKDHCLYDSIKKDNISKASFNLIDLIEVGDYVNGSKVSIIENNGKALGVYEDYIFENEIKEILTHEQYEANRYKVGEYRC